MIPVTRSRARDSSRLAQHYYCSPIRTSVRRNPSSCALHHHHSSSRSTSSTSRIISCSLLVVKCAGTSTRNCTSSCTRTVASTAKTATRKTTIITRLSAKHDVVAADLSLRSHILPQRQHQRHRHLHSSTRKKQSTTALDFTQSSPSLETTTQSAAGSVLVPPPPPDPTYKALRALFVASAIPMVGFGFMDNLVMIQAGQYIDSTLGVKFGLATMTAAAAGQVVSDVSGVIFGGTLERFLTKLSLIESPALTPAQRQLSICRNVSMAGAVCGVIVGCTAGAMTLLLVDLEKRRRIERAQQLREMVTDMILSDDMEVEGLLQAGTCCVYVASAQDFQVDVDDDTDGGAYDGSNDVLKSKTQWRTALKLLPRHNRIDECNHDDDSSSSLVQQCAEKQQLLVSSDRTTLFVPIMEDDELLAVMELRHSSSKRRNIASTSSQIGGGFSETNIRTAKVVARHLAIFMNRLVE